MINSQNVSQANNMKHWAEYLIILAKGVPCTSATPGVLSTTPFNLDVIQNEIYTFKYIADNDYNYSVSSGTFNTNSTAFIYNQGSGATVTPVAV